MTERVVHRVKATRAEGFRFEVSFDAAPSQRVLMDEPAPLGEAAGPNATDLLCAAVANCLAASLLMCLQKSRASVESLTATATATVARNDQGRLRISRIDVEIAPELGPDDAAKLERCRALFEQFCTVTASLRQGVPVEVTLKG